MQIEREREIEVEKYLEGGIDWYISPLSLPTQWPIAI